MDIDCFIDIYSSVKEDMLTKRRFKFNDFNDVISKHSVNSSLKFLKPGSSYEGRPINVLAFGSGSVKVLIWSQMHGNEPTCTLALLDVLNFLESGSDMARLVSQRLSLVIVPLLNPDGNERFDRRNAQGIDVNRDAQSLISPEARLLYSLQTEHHPDFGFNLHDMELYYTSRPENRQTLLALLAPECDYQKSVTPQRMRSMQLLSSVVDGFKGRLDGTVARYSDTYTPDAFGDTFMRRGTSTVLIESGSVAGDPERCQARRAVAVTIMMALHSIATGAYLDFSDTVYTSLPDNMRYNAFDLKVENLLINSKLGSYTVDIGIRRIKPSHNIEDFTDDFCDYRIVNIGKLRNFGGIKVMDATGYSLHGLYSDIYMMRKADFEIVAPDGSIVNITKFL